ncbi:MAG: hypothetical protein ACRERE_09235 [Candidatus Entotheonellia bacterium]
MIRVEEFVEQHLEIFEKRVNAKIKSWKEHYDFAVAMASYGFEITLDETELSEVTTRPDCWLHTLYLTIPEKLSERKAKPPKRLVDRVLKKGFKPNSSVVYREENPVIIQYSWY